MNAAKKPPKRISYCDSFISTAPSSKSLTIFPKISGTTMRNENFAAFSRLMPNKIPVDIVAPEREIPGRIAIAWESPMISDVAKETSFSLFLGLSAISNKPAVIINIDPTSDIC